MFPDLPQKIVSAYFVTRLLHRPGPLSGRRTKFEKKVPILELFPQNSEFLELFQVMSKIYFKYSREMDTTHFSQFFLRIVGILLHVNPGFSFNVSFSKREFFKNNGKRKNLLEAFCI